MLAINPKMVDPNQEIGDIDFSPSRDFLSHQSEEKPDVKKAFTRLKLVLAESKTQLKSWSGVFEVELEETFAQVRSKVAKELEKPASSIQLKFEGQLVADTHTPNDLDMDRMSEEDKDDSIQVDVYLLSSSSKK